jgi:membrane protein
MRLQQIKIALTKTYEEVDRFHMLQMAAAMSYYFVISLFPALIFLSGILAYIPIPDLFNQTLHMIGRFLPADEMSLVQKMLADVILPNRGAFLSFGLLGTVWTASGGLAATIEALNIAYHVEETRPFWKTRPLAVALSFVLGFLLLSALAVMTLGPHFGEWLANRAHGSRIFAVAWPFIHWTIAVGFTILAVELLYFWAPNVKQRFGVWGAGPWRPCTGCGRPPISSRWSWTELKMYAVSNQAHGRGYGPPEEIVRAASRADGNA